jgi:predicted nucleic acid-binding protein
MGEKLKIYLDTSIVSYLDQQDAPFRRAITHKLWEKIKNGEYDIVISTVTTRELDDCKAEKREKLYAYLNEIQYSLVEVTDKIMDIAENIVDFGILKQKSFDDCQHIAAAIISGCDIIVSWNFKHIVNLTTIKGVRAITVLKGYKDLLIFSPSILTEGESQHDTL